MTSMLEVARTGELPPSKRKLVGPCKKKCPGGNKCNCDGSIGHTLHICIDEACWCHSRGRYEQLHDGTVRVTAAHHGHHQRGECARSLSGVPAAAASGVANGCAAHDVRTSGVLPEMATCETRKQGESQ